MNMYMSGVARLIARALENALYKVDGKLSLSLSMGGNKIRGCSPETSNGKELRGVATRS
jgi:hypothetical protein